MPGSAAILFKTASPAPGITPTGQRRELALVRCEHVGQREGRRPETSGRRGVEDRCRTSQASEAERLVRSAGPDLVTDQHDIVRGQHQPLQRVADVRRRHQGVGPAGHGDGVLAGVVDGDQRHAGRLTLDPAQPGTVDLFPLERRTRLVAERVVTHGPDEERRHAEPCGGHGLVAALSTVMSIKTAADDRFAGRGEMGHRDDEVDVDRTDDDDATAHRHRINAETATRLRCRARAAVMSP